MEVKILHVLILQKPSDIDLILLNMNLFIQPIGKQIDVYIERTPG